MAENCVRIAVNVDGCRGQRRLGGVASTAVLGFLLTASLSGSLPAMDLNPEILLSSGMGAAREPALLIGPADSAFMVFVDNDQVRFASRPHENPSSLTVASGPGTRARPSFVVGSGGLVTVGFELVNAGGDVVYAQNPGGPFGSPIALGQETETERRPCLTSSVGTANRHAVWVRDDATNGPTLMVAFDLTAPQSVGPGDAPSCTMSAGGELLVAYERGGDVFLRSGNGVLGAEVTVAGTPAIEGAASVDVGADGLAQVVFERAGDVFYAKALAGGGFAPALNLSNSGAISSAPRIRVAPSGVTFVLYQQQGDLWLATSMGAGFGLPMNLTGTVAATEEAASFDVDDLGFLHITYVRGGEVYYRNNTTPPSAGFSPTGAVGELPFSVSFTDQSTGVVESWLWNFGDGGTSAEPNPVHVYQATGSYTVSLSVSGPGGSDVATVPAAVSVTPATRIMRIPSITVIQGQTDVEIPILASHLMPIQGFQVSMSWDCDVVDLFAATEVNTTTAPLAPEFYVVNIDPVGCFMTAGVIYDTLPPSDGRTLAPGQNQRILDVILNVDPLASTTETTVLNLVNGLGSPFPISNIFIENGQSRSPVLIDGTLTVLPFSLPLPTFFRRGDADRSTQVNVADAVYVLSFLFSNGPPFMCPDSADVNDNGSVDIADAIALLGFLFTGGAAPGYPFPSPGLDPTADSLGPCQ